VKSRVRGQCRGPAPRLGRRPVALLPALRRRQPGARPSAAERCAALGATRRRREGLTNARDPARCRIGRNGLTKVALGRPHPSHLSVHPHGQRLMGGRPCVAGTRVRVMDIVATHRGGLSP
jgi:hypothetical protein